LRSLLRQIRENGRPTGGYEFMATRRDRARIVSYPVEVAPRPPIVHNSVGKAGALCIEMVLLAGGRINLYKFAERMNPKKPGEYIRRVVMRVVGAGLLIRDGDEIYAPDDLEKRLHDHLLDSGALQAEINQKGRLYPRDGKAHDFAVAAPNAEQAA
jgi:hypothetical protein